MEAQPCSREYSLNRLLSAIWLSTSAFGGLLVFPAITPYFWMAIIPIFFVYLAYQQLTSATSRKVLLVTSVIDLIIGIAIGQVFYRSGSLSNAGIVILMLIFAASVGSLIAIWMAEKRVKGDGGN